MYTTAIYKHCYCIHFFSLSEHKASTTELHPKVRQTCHTSFLPVRLLQSQSENVLQAPSLIHEEGE